MWYNSNLATGASAPRSTSMATQSRNRPGGGGELCEDSFTGCGLTAPNGADEVP